MLAVALYAGVARTRSRDNGPDIQLYKVGRRSFPIILQEKGELKAASSIDVRCELEGRSTIIYLVAEGAHVKKGDLLVELASDAIDEKIRDAEIKEAVAKAAMEAAEKELQILRDKNASEIRKAELAKWLAEQDLKKYQEGDSAALRQTTLLAVEKGRYILRRREDQLKDSEQLFQQGYMTRMELDTDRFNLYEAKSDLEKAELAQKVSNEYTIPMNLQEKQSAVREAEKDLDRIQKAAGASEGKSVADVEAKKSEFSLVQDKLEKLRAQKAKARIVATTDGLVVYAREDFWGNADSQIKTGSQVHERQLLIQLPDTSSMKIVLRVHEAKTELLKEGLAATINIEGFGDQSFTGKVSKIAALADSRNRWFNPNLKEYETDVLLDGEFRQLKPGNTATVEILVAELRNVLTVPVQAIFSKGGKYFVFLDENGQARPLEVQIGQSSTQFAEIKGGLQEGQAIRLAITEEMKLKLPDSEKRDGDKPAKPKKPRPASSQPVVVPASAPASRPGK
jgi:HlyD family secretion protein